MPRGSTDKVGRVCVTRPIDGPTAAESDLTLRSRVVDVLGEEERKKKRVSLLYYGTDCGSTIGVEGKVLCSFCQASCWWLSSFLTFLNQIWNFCMKLCFKLEKKF